MPTSTDSNIDMRQLLLKVFSERLDEDLYPKFVEELSPEEIENSVMLFEAYMEWLSNIFKDFGIETIVTPKGERCYLEFLNCPWLDEAQKKPIFCLNCLAMMDRTYRWYGKKVHNSRWVSIVQVSI